MFSHRRALANLTAVAAALAMSFSISGLAYGDEDASTDAPQIAVIEAADQSESDAPTETTEVPVPEPTDPATVVNDEAPAIDETDDATPAADIEPEAPSSTETESAADEQSPDSPELWAFLEVIDRSEDEYGIYYLTYSNGVFVGGDTVTYKLRVQNLSASEVTGVILQGHFDGAGSPPTLACVLASTAAPVNITDGSLDLRPGEQLECGAQYTLVEAERGNQWPITFSVTGSASASGDQAAPMDIAMVSDPALGPSVTSASVEWGVRLGSGPVGNGFVASNGGIPDSTVSVPQDQRTELNLPGIYQSDVFVPELWTSLVGTTQPSHGVVEIEKTMYTRIYYKPNPGFVGTDSFSYMIEDSAGQRVSATVTVTVKPVLVPSGGMVATPNAGMLALAMLLLVLGAGGVALRMVRP